MIDFFIFIFIVLLFFIILIENIRLKNKNTEILFLLTQANIDNELIKNKFDSLNNVEKEHLLSFLNETRDIAYKYIEDVHESLLIFKSEIEDELINPSDDSIKKIKLAFNKLKKIYPEDIPND